MQAVKSVPVHVAVLAVGKDPAPTQAVSDLLLGAGHDIVARATVSDTLAAIKGQVQLWIDDPAIEAVVVAAGPTAAAVVKSLARESTLVFVVPSAHEAARAAMESDVLPQLARARDAVPTAMSPEKTASGSGLSPKLPSMGVRRSPTGANIVRKRDADADASFDPPTKPIDLVQLEEQIALSENPPNDAKTRVVDLSRLPKVPPGADPLPEDTVQTAPAPASSSSKLLPDPPAPRRPVPLPESGHEPNAPPPGNAPVPATRTKPPTEQNPIVRPKALTGPIGVPTVIPKTASGAHALPRQKPPTQPVTTIKPPEPAPSPPPAAIDGTQPIDMIEAEELLPPAAGQPRPKPPTQPPPPPKPRPPTGPVPVARADRKSVV